MKIIQIPLALAISAISLVSSAQTIPADNFRIGNLMEVFGQDSIKIYFNCTGSIVDKSYAAYLRVGKIDTSFINVAGAFSDYDMQGKLYLKAAMIDNSLEGTAHYYYPNGAVKEEGSYRNNIRQGQWTFFYPDGRIAKIYDYHNGEPTVVEAYSADGRTLVANGTGDILMDFSTYKQCDKFKASGHLTNGRRDGNWTFSNLFASSPFGEEAYSDGRFIQGESLGHVYKDSTRFPSLKCFYPNEQLNMAESYFITPGHRIHQATYDDKDLHQTFYPELQQKLSRTHTPIKDQWLIVGIGVNKKSKLETVNVASSINDAAVKDMVYQVLLTMKAWNNAKINDVNVDYDLYFSILVDSNKMIVIPDYLNSRKLQP